MGLLFTPKTTKEILEERGEKRGEARGLKMGEAIAKARLKAKSADWYARMKQAKKEGRDFNEPPPFLGDDWGTNRTGRMQRMTTTTTRLMTAEELLEMPDDGYRYELVRGELVRIMGTGLEHSYIADNCYGSIRAYVMSANLGRVFSSQLSYRLASDPDTVRIPDLGFIRRERLDAIGMIQGYFPGAPDLAIEVISPNDRYRDVESKLSDYFAAGTLMVIVLEPDSRTARVCRSQIDFDVLTEADTLDGGDVVPGWRMPVSEIFE